MIEKMAIAMERSALDNADKVKVCTSREMTRMLARAALDALRDPSDEILSVPGLPYQGNVSHAFGLRTRRDAWNKMIDAILAEVPA